MLIALRLHYRIHKRLGYKMHSVKLGGFSNDDGDGNENNVKKQKF